MTVNELIEILNNLSDEEKELNVYAEGEPATKVIVEGFEGKPQIVRIFKAWDVDFVSPLADMRETDNEKSGSYLLPKM